MQPSSCPEPSACRLSELTQHIRESHHAYLRRELPIIGELLREAVASTAYPAPEIRQFAILFGRFRAALENHLRKEEEVLFPFIERLDLAFGERTQRPRHPFGPLALPIEILEAEHALGDRQLDRMRPIWQRWAADMDGPPRFGPLTARLVLLDADMQRHVEIEDRILFPRTISLEGRPWPMPAASS